MELDKYIYNIYNIKTSVVAIISKMTKVWTNIVLFL